MSGEGRYHKRWLLKTDKQIEKEIISLRKYMDKHSQAYAWHGSDMTPPNCVADGDKMVILKNILQDRTCKKSLHVAKYDGLILANIGSKYGLYGDEPFDFINECNERALKGEADDGQ
jgi:hypothetical protein